MRTRLYRGLIVIWLIATPISASARADFEDHVVSILVSRQKWDEDRPWTKLDPSTLTTPGVVVPGPFILTRASILTDATLIQIERWGDGKRWPAQVFHVDTDIDLALIKLDDVNFFDGLEPARVARHLPTDGDVNSVRWSARQLEIGQSRVQTFKVQNSPTGNLMRMMLSMHSGLDNGGWGEPVFFRGKLIGLTASQKKQRAMVIPVEVIAPYLERALGAEYVTAPSLALEWQYNQDTALSQYLGFTGKARGIVIRGVRHGSSGCGVIMPRDILLEVDGHPIDSAGNYSHPRYGNIRFENIAVEGHEVGDIVDVLVFRAGRELKLQIELRAYTSKLRLIRWRRDTEPPPYLVAGGFVFRELDGAFLRTWGDDWPKQAPLHLSLAYELEKFAPTPGRRRVLVVSTVLPDVYNIGYHDVTNLIVTDVNGMTVDSIRDLAQAFGQPERGDDGSLYQVITFSPNRTHRQAVLDAKTFDEANERILETYAVFADRRYSTETVSSNVAACR